MKRLTPEQVEDFHAARGRVDVCCPKTVVESCRRCMASLRLHTEVGQ